MRIAIDLTPLYNRKWTGVEMYGIDLYRALLTTEHEIIPVFNTKNDVDDNENAWIIPDKPNRLLLENVLLSRAVRKIGADIALFPIFPPPVDLYVACKSRIIPTIHDTASLRYPETINRSFKYYLFPKYKLALKRADRIIAISETTKKQLEGYTRLPVVNLGENIASVFRDAEEKVSVQLLHKWELKPFEYIISVSTIEPRKNIAYLLEVFRDYIINNGLKLVLVGRRGWENDNVLRPLIQEYGSHVIFTEYVEINELISLYHYASAFALLSLDEGFGRTPLEAIACGCKKIIASDIEIFHETLGASATYFPLYDVDRCRLLLNRFESFAGVEKSFKIPFSVMEERLAECSKRH